MRLFAMIGTMLMTMLLCVTAFAQNAVPETLDKLADWLLPLVNAVAKGDWTVAGGIGIMAVVVVLRQYLLPKWNITGWWIQIIAIVVGALANLGFGMATGVSSGEAIWTGVIMALNANGLWTLIGQQVTKLILGDKYQEPATPLQLK